MAPEYCCIAALRGLELKNNNPTMWNRLQLLMDHGDENKKSEMEYYEMFKVFFYMDWVFSAGTIPGEVENNLKYPLHMDYLVLFESSCFCKCD